MWSPCRNTTGQSASNTVHTPGNSSGIVDGSALVLVGTERAGAECGLVPRARVAATAVSGADQTIVLTGPGPATRKALDLTGPTVDDIDLFEIHEAFAAVVLRYVKDLGLPWERTNANGGAIAMGHPLGATGAVLAGTAVDEPERRSARRAVVSLCAGGGMGIATVIERLGRPPSPHLGRACPQERKAAAMPEKNMIRWEQDSDGVVLLTMDDPDQPVNTTNQAHVDSMEATVTRLDAERENISGVVLTSAKKNFFAGGDIGFMSRARPENASELSELCTISKSQLRRLETFGRPGPRPAVLRRRCSCWTN